MSNISLDLSGKIDSLTVELFSRISEVTEKIGVKYFIVGATARDLILEKHHGVPAGRATRDIDLGILVKDWEVFHELRNMLLSSDDFKEGNAFPHGLQYKEITPVDIIPFGGIEDPKGSYAWPPDRQTIMNVQGFQDVFNHAVRIRFDPNLSVLVASLPGLAVLKLFAWKDRRDLLPGQDISDLSLLVRKYGDPVHRERLFEKFTDIMEQEGFDLKRAGSRLLGRDMSELMSPPTRKEILRILKNETNPEESDRLIIALAGELGMDRYEEAQTLLDCLIRGVQESS